MSIFESILKNMISEKNEYKRIENNRLISDLKAEYGKCPQNFKEYIDKMGAKNFKNLEKMANVPIPRQYYVFSILETKNFGYKDDNSLHPILFLTFEEALISVYKTINSLKKQFYDRTYYNFETEMINFDNDENEVKIIFKVIDRKRRKYFPRHIDYHIFTIKRQLITVRPDSTFIVPEYNSDGSGVKVYEI